MTLSNLWDSLLAILRKESKGLAVSPDRFSDLLQIENLALFNEYYRSFEAHQITTDALRKFKASTILGLSYNGTERANYSALPTGYRHCTGVTTGGRLDYDLDNFSGYFPPTTEISTPGTYTTFTDSGYDITSLIKSFGIDAAGGMDGTVSITAGVEHSLVLNVTDNQPITNWYAYPGGDAVLTSTDEYITSLYLATEAPGAFVYSNAFAMGAAETLNLRVRIVGTTNQFKLCLNNKTTADDVAAAFDVDEINLANGSTPVSLTSVLAGNYRLYIRRVVYGDGGHTMTAGQFASDMPKLIVYDFDTITGLDNLLITPLPYLVKGEQSFMFTPSSDSIGFMFYSDFTDVADLSITTSLTEDNLKQIDLVTDEEWVERRLDALTKPTADYPVAKLMGGSIFVYPTSIENILLYYLRVPTTPFFDYYIDANLNIQAMSADTDYVLDAGETYRGEAVLVSSETKSSLTVELEWDEIDQIKILHRILAKLGVSMDEQLVAQYALSQKDS